jgi:glycosyltransferase involved in cell wall biosynthesis
MAHAIVNLIQKRNQAVAAAKPKLSNPPVNNPAEPQRRGLKVLIIAFQGGNQADGGTESLTQIIEHYKGVSITVLTQAETAKNARWRKAGCHVIVRPLHHAPGEGFGRSFFGGLSNVTQHLWWNLQAAALAWNNSIEVAHVNDPHALWHTIFGLRLLGIPTIYNIRDTKHRFTRIGRLKWRVAYLLTQAQIVLSREMRDFWREALKLNAPKLISIYSVIDFDRMRPAMSGERSALRESLAISGGFAVGYVASFSEKKAQLRFIREAGARLQQNGIRVYFIGDYHPETDAYARACRDAVDELGLQEQFAFQGYTPKVDRWYPALDAVVVATQNEGLARCMIESIACGTPVVSFDVCSAREILEKERCGFVVRQGDYEALTQALVLLASDETLRTTLGSRAATVARRHFQANRNVAQYISTYEKVIEKGAAL